MDWRLPGRWTELERAVLHCCGRCADDELGWEEGTPLSQGIRRQVQAQELRHDPGGFLNSDAVISIRVAPYMVFY